MSTRKKEIAGPLSQNRYMSSPEFAELHGVNGVSTAARAAVLLTAEKRNFIWWLQGMSLAEGGFKRLAQELVEMFPDRVADEGRELALRPTRLDGRISHCLESYSQNIEEFLVDLCINPRIHFTLPGDQIDVSDIESDKAIEENPSLSRGDFRQARLNYFRDIIGALFEYRARHIAELRENFQLTAIGKKIWETLDYALAVNGMVLLDGLEGRGKTEAVKAWCGLHLGTARFVSLKGITSKTTAFREMARALGIASSYTRTAPEMQARIEDVLKRSKLLLVVDEAHFAFSQSRRVSSRPELIDWIDTAICNRGIGIALCTTPQFIVCMTRAADQVEWNYRQFRRRVKRWVELPKANTENDIRAVVRNVFKKANEKMIDLITGYAVLSKRDLSAVGDVADEVRAILGHADLSKATLNQAHQVIYGYLLPSDKTFLEGMEAARRIVKRPSRNSTQAALSVSDDKSSMAGAQRQPVATSEDSTDLGHIHRTCGSLDVPGHRLNNPAMNRADSAGVLTVH